METDITSCILRQDLRDLSKRLRDNKRKQKPVRRPPSRARVAGRGKRYGK